MDAAALASRGLPPALSARTAALSARLKGVVDDACGPDAESPARRLWMAALTRVATLAPGLCHEGGVPSEEEEAPPSLSALLALWDVSLPAFLKELPVVAARAGPALGPAAAGLDRTLRVRELQSSYVYGSVLAKKCGDVLRPFLAATSGPAPAHHHPPPHPAAAAVPRLTWALFLSAKAAVLPAHPDLVTAFALLLACANWALAHAPAGALAPSARTPRGWGGGGGGDGAAVDTLRALAAAHRAPWAEVEALARLVDGHARAVLVDGGVVAGEPDAAHPLGWTTHVTRLAGVLPAGEGGGDGDASDPAAPPAAVLAALDAAYEAAHGTASEVDERPFFGVGGAVGPPPSTVTRSGSGHTTTSGGSAGSPPPRCRGPTPPTALGLMGASPPRPTPPPSCGFGGGPGAGAGAGLETPPSLSKCRLGDGTPAPPASVFAAAHHPGATPVRLLPSPGPGLPSPSTRLVAPSAGAASGYGLGTPGALLARGRSTGTNPGATPRAGPPLHPGLATPVSSTMAALAWLRGVVASVPTDANSGGPAPPARLAAVLDAVGGPAGCGAAALTATAAEGAARVFGCAAASEAAAGGSPSSGSAAALGAESGLTALLATQAAERAREATALYLVALDALLVGGGGERGGERGKRGGDGAPPTAPSRSLVTCATFHAAVLAQACEAVAAAYRCAALPFPAVLDALRLPAFEAAKAVDAVASALGSTGLPREVRRHLFAVEERCLESAAWAAGSPLYALLAASGGGGGGSRSPRLASPVSPPAAGLASPPTAATPTKRKSGGSDGAPSPDATSPVVAGGCADAAAAPPPAGEQLCSPSKAPRRAAGAAGRPDTPGASAAAAAAAAAAATAPPPPAALPTLPNVPPAFGTPPDGRPPPSGPRAVAAAFLSRVLRLAALRGAALVDRLDPAGLPPRSDRRTLASQVHTALAAIVWEHTHLLYGRHVDAVVLCATYGVAKAQRAARPSFRDIISAYRRLPHARPSVFRCVPVEQAFEAGLAAEAGGGGEAPPPARRPRHCGPADGSGLAAVRSGDVIEFYNSVFVGAAKADLLRIGSGRAALLPVPAGYGPFVGEGGGVAVAGATPPPLGTPPPPFLGGASPPPPPVGRSPGEVWLSPMTAATAADRARAVAAAAAAAGGAGASPAPPPGLQPPALRVAGFGAGMVGGGSPPAAGVVPPPGGLSVRLGRRTSGGGSPRSPASPAAGTPAPASTTATFAVGSPRAGFDAINAALEAAGKAATPPPPSSTARARTRAGAAAAVAAAAGSATTPARSPRAALRSPTKAARSPGTARAAASVASRATAGSGEQLRGLVAAAAAAAAGGPPAASPRGAAH